MKIIYYFHFHSFSLSFSLSFSVIFTHFHSLHSFPLSFPLRGGPTLTSSLSIQFKSTHRSADLLHGSARQRHLVHTLAVSAAHSPRRRRQYSFTTEASTAAHPTRRHQQLFISASNKPSEAACSPRWHQLQHVQLGHGIDGDIIDSGIDVVSW